MVGGGGYQSVNSMVLPSMNLHQTTFSNIILSDDFLCMSVRFLSEVYSVNASSLCVTIVDGGEHGG